MVNVYTVTFLKKDNIKYSFTSLNALYDQFGREEIGVRKETLYNVFALKPQYKNYRVIIDKYPAFTTADVREKKVISHQKC